MSLILLRRRYFGVYGTHNRICIDWAGLSAISMLLQECRTFLNENAIYVNKELLWIPTQWCSFRTKGGGRHNTSTFVHPVHFWLVVFPQNR